MSYRYQLPKPENIIRRAEEFEKVGKTDEALELLFTSLRSQATKKNKMTWSKVHEEMTNKLLTACVELRNSHLAKEALHFYRKMCESQAPGSLEAVIRLLLKKAEEKASAARAESDIAINSIDDLETSESPESLMLSFTSHENTEDRTARTVVVPWMRFLSDTYRNCADIVRNNAQLEKLYHDICRMSFKFCSNYQRTNEFRRLCDVMRSHRNKLHTETWMRNRVIWSYESTELHLFTRFEQLETASYLKMWTEGFRTIEDIHEIMDLSDRTPRPVLMATYYDKLSTLFWVSENYLFHAYALKHFYVISKMHNKRLGKEQLESMASCVLLAALSIPTYSSSADLNSTEFSVEKEKNLKMAALLGFSTETTRASLLAELGRVGLVNDVSPELKALYTLLEVDFHPLTMVKSLSPCFELMQSNDKMKIYVSQLERLMVLRLLKQLSTIYKTVKLDTLTQLVEGLSISSDDVEVLIVRAVKNRQLSARLDHSSGTVVFGDDLAEEERIRKQLSVLSKRLYRALKIVNPNMNTGSLPDREDFFSKVRDHMDEEHHQALSRKDTIEKRKEMYERMQHMQAKEEEKRRVEVEAKAKAQEEKRLKQEAKNREAARKARIDAELILKETIKTMKQLGQDVEDMKREDLENVDHKKLLREGKERALKVVEQRQKKLREKSNRLDYRTRALRECECKKIKETVAAQSAEERISLLTRFASFKKANAEKHVSSLAKKHSLASMNDDRLTFELNMSNKSLSDAKSAARRVGKLKRARERKYESDRLAADAEAEEKRIREAEQAALDKEARLAAEKEEATYSRNSEFGSLQSTVGESNDGDSWRRSGMREERSDENRHGRSSRFGENRNADSRDGFSRGGFGDRKDHDDGRKGWGESRTSDRRDGEETHREAPRFVGKTTSGSSWRDRQKK